MAVMQRIKLSSLLWIVVALPVFALTTLAAVLIHDGWTTYQPVQRANRLERLADAAATFSATAAPNEGRSTYPYLIEASEEHARPCRASGP